jgi:ribonuclease BN (tRNA processing enzyme)
MRAYIDELDARVVEFARGASLLVIDGQYTADEYQKKLGWGHATMDDAAEVARRAGVERVAVYHHDPVHDDATLDAHCARLAKQLRDRGAATQILFAAEGLELEL